MSTSICGTNEERNNMVPDVTRAAATPQRIHSTTFNPTYKQSPLTCSVPCTTGGTQLDSVQSAARKAYKETSQRVVGALRIIGHCVCVSLCPLHQPQPKGSCRVCTKECPIELTQASDVGRQSCIQGLQRFLPEDRTAGHTRVCSNSVS